MTWAYEWFLDKAFDIANNYPKGPVQLSIPTNFVFTGKVESLPNEDARTFDNRKKTHRPHPDLEDIKQIVAMLAHSLSVIISAVVFGIVKLIKCWRVLPLIIIS